MSIVIFKHIKISGTCQTNKNINSNKNISRKFLDEKFRKINNIFKRFIKNEKKWIRFGYSNSLANEKVTTLK